MWLADHMHAAPHAEQHVLEVCQFETPAVFTSATLPIVHTHTPVKLSNETKRFDKWPQTAYYACFLLQALDGF